MTPYSIPSQRGPGRWLENRRGFLQALAAAGGAALAGCANPLFRGQSPELETTEAAEKGPEVVGDYASASGLKWLKLEAVALVTNLDNSGSDPPASPLRNQLVAEMQSHEVDNPNQVLGNPRNSLVLLRAFLPPGMQKGDRFDVEIRLPPRSETTSLAGGWLMPSRLRQVAVLGGALHTGAVEGLAKGDVLVDSLFQSEQAPASLKHGRVLGGGVSLVSRKLGLVINKSDSSIRTSLMVAGAVNNRFHTFQQGIKTGVCKPKQDDFIELSVPPRYKNNVGRFLQVIRYIPVRESPPQRVERLQLLAKKLLQPSSAGPTALQLEAIGKESVEVLQQGLAVSDPEVRFYSAEALAHFDEPAAARPLAEAALGQHAFRWHALAALTVMDHLAAYEALSDLLHCDSVETRYGAFRALWTRNPQDPAIRGEDLVAGSQPSEESEAPAASAARFSYHLLATTGDPLIHFTRSKRPEVVVFGTQIPLTPREPLVIGPQLVIKADGGGQVKISRFTPGRQDQVEACAPAVDPLIRAIVRVGGGYPEVMQTIHEARRQGWLQARVEVEALAQPGRAFHRDADGPESSADESGPETNSPANVDSPASEATAEETPAGTGLIVSPERVSSPRAELFQDKLSQQAPDPPRSQRIVAEVDDAYREPTSPSFLDRMRSWWSP